MMGVPTTADEKTLRRLGARSCAGKVMVKLLLRHALHAELYLLYRDDPVNPIVGYVGSGHLRFNGLSGQGEINIDVPNHDAFTKLKDWFEDRWNDRFCIDITKELIEIIEESWAREDLIPPYHIYLKMAYHLSHKARAGLAEFRIPHDFGDKLFDFNQHVDDLRELMRLYMARRTRGFIQDNYAETDSDGGRKYLTSEDGSRSSSPTGVPKTAKFTTDEPGDNAAMTPSQTSKPLWISSLRW